MSQNFNEPKPERSFLDAAGHAGAKITADVTVDGRLHHPSSLPLGDLVEAGWVIVRGGSELPLEYYCLVDGDVKWSADNALALRFARQVDAENLVKVAMPNVHPTLPQPRAEEHLWYTLY